MMRITILTVGSPKQTFVREGVAEFTKRLSRYAQVDIIHINETKEEKQTAAYIARTSARGTLVLLDEHGVTYTSPSFATYLEKKGAHGEHLFFCIGGPDGHTESVRALRHEKMSLSALTLPHELALLLFTETLYRSLSISAGHPYHRP